MRYWLAAGLTCLALSVSAASGRTDYDLDDNGLIEINDWADLDAIRTALDGKSLHGSSAGCPAAGCRGFELTASLDFDTNADGKIDAQDAFWNQGKGWRPLGSKNQPFSAEFDGKGQQIRNLWIQGSDTELGLFGVVRQGKLSRLALTGPLLSITGRESVGILAGWIQDSEVVAVLTTGQVYNNFVWAGGLVGKADTSRIQAVFSSAQVQGYIYAGGLVGESQDTLIEGSLATGRARLLINGNSAGGLAAGGESQQISSRIGHWALDTTGQPTNQAKAGLGALLAELRCPLKADDSHCAPGKTLYPGWSEFQDASGQAYWQFGDGNQLPGLLLNGHLYRDSDGDGVLDGEEAFPRVYGASQDSDGDGAPDSWQAACDAACVRQTGLVLDQFPNNLAASLDADLDGLPDAWSPGCDSQCQAGSGLTLDARLGDRDNDGIADQDDTDDDNDGKPDVDLDSNGLIDIHSWAELDAVRHQLDGRGQRLTKEASLNSSGCPGRVWQGQWVAGCVGYELKADLDFDTNGDGKLDEQDQFWNAGKGWQTLGDWEAPFSAVFAGNGHLIRNLMLNNSSGKQGLFGSTRDAQIRELGLTGPLTSIRGGTSVGGLVGELFYSSVEACFISGGQVVAETWNAGGLVGITHQGRISASYASTQVSSKYGSGGLVAETWDSQLSGVYSTSPVVAGAALAPGNATRSPILNSYWARDIDPNMSYSVGVGVMLYQLKCPVAANDSLCAVGATLYQDWQQWVDASGRPYWDFGDNQQLPALRLNGKIYRDSDADGLLDDDDADDDNDGVPDSDDAFPYSFAASVDQNANGLPDAWNPACDSACQQASGLTLDPHVAEIYSLWRHSDGRNYGLKFRGNQLTDDYPLVRVSNDWQLLGSGDFNGDGATDLVWRHWLTGEVYLFLFKDGQIQQQFSLGRVADLDWQLKAIADVDGDQTSDFIWYHAKTGAGVSWLFQQGKVVKELTLPQLTSLDWQLVGSGDLTGDGVADLVWRHSQTGDIWLFVMAQGQFQQELPLFSVADPAWQLKAVADTDADGHADLLWMHQQTGVVYQFLMQANQIKQQGQVLQLPDLSWQLAAVQDWDQDGKADLVWRNRITGQNYLFLLDGLSLKAGHSLPTVADTGWDLKALLLP